MTPLSPSSRQRSSSSKPVSNKRSCGPATHMPRRRTRRRSYGSRASAALRAELVLVKKGVNTGAEPDADNGFMDPEEEGVSLRTRLSRAVESKRPTSDDDTHQWR